MTPERRLSTFIETVRYAAIVMQPHEVRAVLRFALRSVAPDVLVRLATAVAFVEAHESYEHGQLGRVQ